MIIDSDLEEKILTLLRSYSKENSEIDPANKPEFSLGYTYEKFDEILTGCDFTSFALLNELYERNLLSRVIFDRVFTCPECKTWKINLREICPSCHGLNWKKKFLYHHFACGYVGLESEFKVQSAEDLFCPKCEEELRHIGLDYEKPTQSYYCDSCKHIFNEHDIEGKCLGCNAKTPVEKLIPQNIYTYKINRKTVRALDENSLKSISIEDVIEDNNTQSFTLDYAIYFLERQKKIALEYGDSIAILVASGDTTDHFLNMAKSKLSPSFIAVVYKDSLLICGTRGSFDKQEEILTSLIDEFYEENHSHLLFNIYDLDFNSKVRSQLIKFIEENDKRDEETE